MRTYLAKKTAERPLSCQCNEADISPDKSSLIIVLSCSLAASIVWAILATWRPSWIKTLKEKLINVIARCSSRAKKCSPESPITPSAPELPTAPQDPPATTNLKARRQRIRVCPYKRSELQLRKQIQKETFQELRRLISLAKQEAATEVEEELKNEAAIVAALTKTDVVTIFENQ